MIDFENGRGPVRVADYYRVEAEFKAVDGAVLPWTMLSDPDPYFAGAAPFCAGLVEVAPKRIPMMPSEFDAKVSLAASMEHCRTAYGGLLRSLLLKFMEIQQTSKRGCLMNCPVTSLRRGLSKRAFTW